MKGPACALVAVCALLAGCVPRAPESPAVAFWNSVRSLCGRAFEGTAVELSAVDGAVSGQRLVLDVWQCYHDELRLVFHVGEDRSRVWRLTRARDGGELRLIHDIHGADGSPAAVTGYGGAAAAAGSAGRQEFAADTETTSRIPSAAGSVWAIEIAPGERLTYAFHSGDGDIRFRVDFDLSRMTSRPPPPWGLTRQSRPAS